MKMKIRILAVLLANVVAGSAVAQDRDAMVAEGKTLIKEFSKALKAELMTAIKDGGPVNAIEVCNVRAPEIATSVSEGSGWTVARSSHKLRNPQNAPDAYTAQAIDAFLTRQAAGEPAAELVKAETVEEDGQQVFRMVKAIPTGEVCLACHGGEQVTPEVAAAIADFYPQDEARGFTVGEMRGVFTLRKPLN